MRLCCKYTKASKSKGDVTETDRNPYLHNLMGNWIESRVNYQTSPKP